MRLRIEFAKTAQMRFTSHLDLHRAWERTFRRANLPLVYSQGYNPRPRFNLASALPLGFTSQGEVLDLWLETNIPLTTIQANITKALPPGLSIHSIQEIDNQAATLQVDIRAAEYEITFLEPFPDLAKRCLTLLQAENLPRERRGKHYDLRPLILTLEQTIDDAMGNQRVKTRLLAQESATGRPEEVIFVLGKDPMKTKIHRTRLIFSSAIENASDVVEF